MHDYHMHSHFCRHAAGRLEDYARSAQSRGVEEICFTPHIPLPGFRPGFLGDRLRMDAREFDPYLEELEKTRAMFPGLTILSGVEADYIEGMEGYLESFLSSHDFDFVLMSIHFVAAWPSDEWVFGINHGRELRGVYHDYFTAMKRGIQTGLFDCVAHMDLIKQPGKPVLSTNRDDVEEVLELCSRQGMSVELNTSGARKEIAETYPCDDVIRLMIRHGSAVVTGSDSHDPSQVGFYFSNVASRFGPPLTEKIVRYRGRVMTAPGKKILSAQGS